MSWLSTIIKEGLQKALGTAKGATVDEEATLLLGALENNSTVQSVVACAAAIAELPASPVAAINKIGAIVIALDPQIATQIDTETEALVTSALTTAGVSAATIVAVVPTIMAAITAAEKKLGLPL